MPPLMAAVSSGLPESSCFASGSVGMCVLPSRAQLGLQSLAPHGKLRWRRTALAGLQPLGNCLNQEQLIMIDHRICTLCFLLQASLEVLEAISSCNSCCHAVSIKNLTPPFC